jgi:hypothetical protein
VQVQNGGQILGQYDTHPPGTYDQEGWNVALYGVIPVSGVIGFNLYASLAIYPPDQLPDSVFTTTLLTASWINPTIDFTVSFTLAGASSGPVQGNGSGGCS